jgi:hypothetical protein
VIRTGDLFLRTGKVVRRYRLLTRLQSTTTL